MGRILSVKKKGYNDDPRYTEYFLHNALQKFGYSLTRDSNTADFAITAYIDHRVNHMLFISPFFDQISEEDIDEYSKEISMAMKGESVFLPQLDEIKTQGVAIYHFLFSSKTNAFAEPAIVDSGKTLLEIAGHSSSLGHIGSFGFKVINFGGPSQGMDIVIKTSYPENLFLNIEDAQIRRYTKKGMITEKLVFKKSKNQYICRMDDFKIHPGLNKNSAAWCRSRTKYQDSEFYIDFTITSRVPIFSDINLTINPHWGEGFSIKIN